MRLILARHGETEENKEKIFQGWLPGHLSEKGKEQAYLLAERLRNRKIDFIYTSDLRRSAETAEVIAKYHLNVELIEEKLLRERGLGEFEGKKIGEVDWGTLPGDFLTTRPRGGENFGEVQKRFEDFYKKIISKHPRDTILVVGHESLCLLQGVIYNIDLQESLKLEKLKNAAISEFDIDRDGKYEIVCLNCEKHL